MYVLVNYKRGGGGVEDCWVLLGSRCIYCLNDEMEP